MTQPDTWYVAFGPDKAVKTDDSATGMVRSTRTFKSEVDAKLFAMQILAKGWTATAGTLNPHQPKQVVGASEIERWADPDAGGWRSILRLWRRNDLGAFGQDAPCNSVRCHLHIRRQLLDAARLDEAAARRERAITRRLVERGRRSRDGFQPLAAFGAVHGGGQLTARVRMHP